MQTQPRLLSQHRFARLVRWAQLMLLWLLEVLTFQTPRFNTRRWRRSKGALRRLERLIRALVAVRAIELAGVRIRKRARKHNPAPPGFRARACRANLRAALGARFRKALRHRDCRVRIERLAAALANLDAFVRRYVLRRVGRLARFWPIVMTAPPADAVASLAAPPAAASDTS